MSGRINIEPDQLKELASELGQRERECGTLTDLLEWNYSMARSVYPEMDCTYSGALYQGLTQKLTQYRSLLDEAQAVVKRTEMEFRQLDEGFLSKLGQFGLDMVGYYDVIRIGAEYDPLTGEKLSGWDHLIAGGWTAFNLASFGLGGLAAKGAVKLFKSVKNVLHTSVVGSMLKGAFNAAKSGVLSGVYRAGQALKNVTLFPGFRMVTGDGRLISTPPMKADDLVQRFSKNGATAEKRAGVGTQGMGKPFTPESYSNHNDIPYSKVRTEKVVNALNNFESKKWTFGNENILLDKSGIKHMLERHHPEFYSGTLPKDPSIPQSFFDKSMSIDDLATAIDSVLKQNRDKIMEKGTKFSYQISGKYSGAEYILGFNKGRIGQFYPVPK